MGKKSTFTTKEFDLLSFLAQNPNHVFTKEELFSKIWDMNPLEILQLYRRILKRFERRLSLIPQSLSILRLSGEWGIGLRYNESKRKQAPPRAAFVSWAINEGSACVAGSGARQRGKPEFTPKSRRKNL